MGGMGGTDGRRMMTTTMTGVAGGRTREATRRKRRRLPRGAGVSGSYYTTLQDPLDISKMFNSDFVLVLYQRPS